MLSVREVDPLNSTLEVKTQRVIFACGRKVIKGALGQDKKVTFLLDTLDGLDLFLLGGGG